MREPGSEDREPPPRKLSYGSQAVDQSDIDAVVAILRGDWLTQGPAVTAFEEAIREATTARYAVAFSSGTAALHAAAAAAGLGPGDVVATSALTFSASAACVRYVGATPTLLDVDPQTLNLDPAAVPDGLDGLVAVHYAGLSVDLAELRNRPRVVIEDACHAFGAMTATGPVGSCEYSDMAAFSFHPVKPITTCEGGAVTTNDPLLAENLRRFRNHGIVRRPDIDPWYYEVSSLGFNYRLSDVQAALGVSQIGKLSRFIERRNEIATRYRHGFDGSNVTLPPAAPRGWTHGYHLFAVRVPERRRVFDFLVSRGIVPQVHYVPIHHHPMYSDLGFGPTDLPNVEAAYRQLLSIPMHPSLTDDDVDRVVAALIEATE